MSFLSRFFWLTLMLELVLFTTSFTIMQYEETASHFPNTESTKEKSVHDDSTNAPFKTSLFETVELKENTKEDDSSVITPLFISLGFNNENIPSQSFFCKASHIIVYATVRKPIIACYILLPQD